MSLFCAECLKKTSDPEAAREASYLVDGTSLFTDHAARAVGVRLGGVAPQGGPVRVRPGPLVQEP